MVWCGVCCGVVWCRGVVRSGVGLGGRPGKVVSYLLYPADRIVEVMSQFGQLCGEGTVSAHFTVKLGFDHVQSCVESRQHRVMLGRCLRLRVSTSH